MKIDMEWALEKAKKVCEFHKPEYSNPEPDCGYCRELAEAILSAAQEAYLLAEQRGLIRQLEGEKEYYKRGKAEMQDVVEARESLICERTRELADMSELGPCGRHPRACLVQTGIQADDEMDVPHECSACAQEQQALENLRERCAVEGMNATIRKVPLYPALRPAKGDT